MILIKNNNISLEINQKGAEIESLRYKNSELIHIRDNNWQAQSPLLFPIIGCLKDGYYEYENNQYILSPHGFGKNIYFTVKNQTEDSVTLYHQYSLTDINEYPFKYEIYIIYKIDSNSVSIDLKVNNIDEKKMYFNIGIHPGYSYNGIKSLVGDEFEFVFNGDNMKKIIFDPTFVIGKEEFKSNHYSLRKLEDELFEFKTIAVNSNKLDIIGKKNVISISHTMQNLALWQKRCETQKFICIEGWCGAPDFSNADHQIQNKRNMISLDSKSSFETKYIINIGVNYEIN